MSNERYRELENRRRYLFNCGCDSCREEVRRLERELHQLENYRYSWYQSNPRIGDTLRIRMPKDYLLGVDMVKPEPEPEIKNIAVKLLVNKLKADQSNLSSAENMIASIKKTLKVYTDQKNTAQKNIKELAAALKKLGHKTND